MTREERIRKLYTHRLVIFILSMAKMGYRMTDSKDTETTCLNFIGKEGKTAYKFVTVDVDNLLLCTEEDFYNYISEFEGRNNGDLRERSILPPVVSEV